MKHPVLLLMQYIFAFRMSLQNFALGIYSMPEFFLLFLLKHRHCGNCATDVQCYVHGTYVWNGGRLFHEPIRAIYLIVIRGFSKSAW